jgi:hypothetical protein
MDVALVNELPARELVATELPLRAPRAVEEQLLFGAVVDRVGAPTLMVQETPDRSALHAPDHALLQN